MHKPSEPNRPCLIKRFILSGSWRWAVIAASILLIYSLALLPTMRHPLGDKTEHVAAFIFLGVLFRRSGTRLSRNLPGLPVLFAMGFGIEILQFTLSTGRTASAADALASCIGAIAGMTAGNLRGPRLIAAFPALGLLALATNWVMNSGLTRFS